MITIKYLQMKQISVSNNSLGVDMSLNKPKQTKLLNCYDYNQAFTKESHSGIH